MAEKDFSIDNNNAAPDSQLVLKKRARRRLVGAIALALLAVIVLPMVMDQAPQPLTQDIQIRIPSQDPGATTFVSRMAPKLAPTPTPLPQDTDKVPTPTDTATPVPAVSAVHVAAPPLATETQSEAQTSSKAAPKQRPNLTQKQHRPRQRRLLHQPPKPPHRHLHRTKNHPQSLPWPTLQKRPPSQPVLSHCSMTSIGLSSSAPTAMPKPSSQSPPESRHLACRRSPKKSTRRKARVHGYAAGRLPAAKPQIKRRNV